MNASDVMKFLDGSLSPSEFERRVGVESSKWASRLSLRGGSAPIVLDGMGRRYYVTVEKARGFLDAVLRKEISIATFAYVLEALLLEERFEWSNLSVRDSLEETLETETPGQFDARRIWRAHGEIQSLDKA